MCVRTQASMYEEGYRVGYISVNKITLLVFFNFVVPKKPTCRELM